MEKKMSYKVALEKAIEVVADEEVKERLEALKESIVKKYSGKSEKVAQAQSAVDEAVLAVLTDEAQSATAIFAKDAEALGSVPKVTASLTRLVADGKAEKVAISGKKTGYKLV